MTPKILDPCMTRAALWTAHISVRTRQLTRWVASLARWATQHEVRQLRRMIGLIALVHFVVEAMIMGALSSWHLTRDVVMEGLLDCTLLTLLSTPPIYYWVVKPYATASSAAREALANELDLRAQQTAQLECALSELKRLLSQNEDLRRRLQEASFTTTEINENILQRIGADLHDGPAQLLAYTMLRLSKFASAVKEAPDGKGIETLNQVRAAVSDALREVRNISYGLALPELQAAALDETIKLAVAQHQDRTGTKVQLAIESLPDNVPPALKTCAYRFVQEGLTNAYRHAGAREQRVEVRANNTIEILVSDKGPGFLPDTDKTAGLGLSGMRARVESLGGQFSINTGLGIGVCLKAQFHLNALSEVR